MNISHHWEIAYYQILLLHNFSGDKLKYPNYEGDQPRNLITASCPTIIYFRCFSFYYINSFIRLKSPYNITVSTRRFQNWKRHLSTKRKRIGANHDDALFSNNRRNADISHYPHNFPSVRPAHASLWDRSEQERRGQGNIFDLHRVHKPLFYKIISRSHLINQEFPRYSIGQISYQNIWVVIANI